MNPKYLWEDRKWAQPPSPPILAGPSPTMIAPGHPLTFQSLSLPLTCCSLDGIHSKRCFLTGKSGYIYSPTEGRREAGVSGIQGLQRSGGGGLGAGTGEVTLASWESSALTPIFTPRTLISRTQLDGGLKCTVSRRVVAICGQGMQIRRWMSLSPGEDGDRAGGGRPSEGSGEQAPFA